MQNTALLRPMLVASALNYTLAAAVVALSAQCSKELIKVNQKVVRTALAMGTEWARTSALSACCFQEPHRCRDHRARIVRAQIINRNEMI